MEKIFKGNATRIFTCFVVLIIAIATVFSGCTSAKANEGNKTDDNQGTEPVTQTRDDIIIAMESEAPTLHPFDHKSVTAGYMNALTYNQLFKIDLDTLEPIADLCESYETVTDSEWVFKIYEGVKFHDGSVMTAHDVVASMEWAKTFTTTKDYTSFWTSIEVIDDHTIRVTTDGPYALVLNNMASIKIVPKALIDAGHDFATSPIGSGPYVFEGQTLGEAINFKAFPDYFDTEHVASITNMTWRIIPEGSSRTIALEAGEVDVVIEVESNDSTRIEESDKMTLYKVGGTRLNFMCMNSEVYPFNNKDFRKAMNAAIDRDSVVLVACNGEATAAISQTPMVFQGSSTENAQGYDVEAAKDYLAKSGVDTETFVFSCIVSNDAARRAAEVIQANLWEIGINMDIENMDYATQLSAIMSGDYQASIIGYTSNDMCLYLQGLFHTDAMNAANLARISDATVDGLIDAGKTQIDSAERAETFKQATEYLNDWAPFVPLYQSLVTRASTSELQGFKVGASGGMRFENAYWAE